MVPKRKGSELPDGQEHPDDTYVFQRADDRSKWMKASYLIDKYRPLVWLVFGLLVSAGYGFKTPRTAQEEANQRLVDIAQRLDSTNVRVANLERVAVSVEALVRIRCIDDASDVMRAAGIDCSKWLSNTPLNPPQP